MIWYDMIWYYMIWYDMIWYNVTINHDSLIWQTSIMQWHKIIWYSMIPPMLAREREIKREIRGSEKGEVLLRGVGTLRYVCWSSRKTLLVKCPSVQWQPDGLTTHSKKLFLGAGFLGAPHISLNLSNISCLTHAFFESGE